MWYYMYTYMHTCIHAYTHTHIWYDQLSTFLHTYTHTHICIYIYIYTHTPMHIWYTSAPANAIRVRRKVSQWGVARPCRAHWRYLGAPGKVLPCRCYVKMFEYIQSTYITHTRTHTHTHTHTHTRHTSHSSSLLCLLWLPASLATWTRRLRTFHP